MRIAGLAVVSRLEARVGIEPTYKGFADPLLATPTLSDSTHVPITINFGPVFVRVTMNRSAPLSVRGAEGRSASTLGRLQRSSNKDIATLNAG